MKYSLLIVFFLFSLFTSLPSCDKEGYEPGYPDAEDTNSNNNPNPTGSKMRIKIGNSIFTATLYDNATATAFKVLFPMTVTMVKLNGNEKYIDLPGNLPTNALSPGTIQNGDLMLYGSNTFVLF